MMRRDSPIDEIVFPIGVLLTRISICTHTPRKAEEFVLLNFFVRVSTVRVTMFFFFLFVFLFDQANLASRLRGTSPSQPPFGLTFSAV